MYNEKPILWGNPTYNCGLPKKNTTILPKNIVTHDVQHFWEAYDKVIEIDDPDHQKEVFQNSFWDKASIGQKAMFEVRDYTPLDYLNAINEYPNFWNSIRKNTSKVDEFVPQLQDGIDALKQLYPNLKPAKIYFTIGALRSNGTTRDSLVLIGSELALGDSSTNIEELPDHLNHLATFFETDPKENLVFLNTHEFVHTQQSTTVGNSLLAQTLIEGTAEFVAEKALGVSSPNPQISYGENNKQKIKEAFVKEITSPLISNWFWNSNDNEFGMRDLGYYVGYEICKSYYDQAANKNVAIKEMIELDYNNNEALLHFVNASYFFEQPIEVYNEVFQMSRPKVIQVYGTKYGRAPISSKTTKISVEFSESLDTNRISTDFGNLGQDHFPTIEKAEFSNNGKILNYHIALEPEKEYEMVLHWNMRSEKGIPLQPYTVKFYTGK